MHTFVGLMCWFAAKVPRSPCLAWLTASAMRPTPSKSGERNRVTPSPSPRRSPAMSLSAIGSKAASDSRSRSITGDIWFPLRTQPCLAPHRVGCRRAIRGSRRARLQTHRTGSGTVSRFDLAVQVRHRVADRLQLLGVLVRNVDVELLLEFHHELDDVEPVGTRVLDEARVIRELLTLDAKLLLDDVLHLLRVI